MPKGTCVGTEVTATLPAAAPRLRRALTLWDLILYGMIVLQPVARLLVSGSTLGGDLTLVASSEMRNESQ